MNEKLTRKEQKTENDKKTEALSNKMRESLAEISKSSAGINVLRYLLHESRFLAPLTYETALGVNTEVLLSNEAKRRMYLGLRAYMDVDTVKRVELDGIKQEE